MSTRPTSNNLNPVLDDATITRVMNLLSAEGLFERPQGERAVAIASPSSARTRQRVLRVQASAVSPLRDRSYGWLGTAAMALCAALVLGPAGAPVRQSSADSGAWTKSHTATSVQLVRVLDPEAEAVRLKGILADLGVNSEVRAVGTVRQVLADIPSFSLVKVKDGLAEEGLSLQNERTLAVQFEPLRPDRIRSH